ncbi:g8979 [Coccomyxa elongata]
MGSKKVLLSGSVDGKVSALFKRVSAVNKSNGPFDMLLCTGRFFADAESSGDTVEEDTELADYVTGAKEVPLPTYFIGSFGRGAAHAIESLSDADASVRYLGRSGIKQLHGLNLAYLDGTYDKQAFEDGSTTASCRHYSKEDVRALERAVDRAEGDVDILLTCEWPADVTAAVPPGSAPADVGSTGSAVVASLATKVRPRYHISGGKDVFYARPPYLNKDLGAGAHVTRFIALGSVGNAAKAKSLHALALVPAADMDVATLTQRPEGTTPCPYELPSTSKRGLPGDDDGLGEQSWRWQQNKRSKGGHAAPSLGRPDVVKDERKTVYVKNLPYRASEDDIIAFFSQAGPVADVRRGAEADGKLHGYGFVQFESEEAATKACQLHGTEFMGRELTVDVSTSGARAPSGKPVEGCWFCLSNPNADVNLVASIGEECYVVADKGPIVDSHVLVLPVEHYPSQLSLSASSFAEMERYLSALRSCFASQGSELFAFERYMTFRKSGGNHCQLNVLPVSAAAAASARADVQRLARDHGVPLQPLDGPSKGEAGREALRQAVGDGEYFVAVLPDGSRLVHAITRGEKHPLNFGREVAAVLAGAPGRADWKKCASTPREEAARTAKFKQLFKPHDIMQ